jgi:hypothetical protein
MRIVQIAPELDETFVSIGDVLVDSRSRMWAAELVESLRMNLDELVALLDNSN